jgi:hypothetical protein
MGQRATPNNRPPFKKNGVKCASCGEPKAYQRHKPGRRSYCPECHRKLRKWLDEVRHKKRSFERAYG